MRVKFTHQAGSAAGEATGRARRPAAAPAAAAGGGGKEDPSSLPPSWVARRQQQERLKASAPAGTKIVFADDDKVSARPKVSAGSARAQISPAPPSKAWREPQQFGRERPQLFGGRGARSPALSAPSNPHRRAPEPVPAPEGLHGSWAAKLQQRQKQQQALLAHATGTKIVFD